MFSLIKEISYNMNLVNIYFKQHLKTQVLTLAQLSPSLSLLFVASLQILPEVYRLICMWSSQFNEKDPEDVDEEENVASNTQKSWQVGDPLNPNLQVKNS